LDLRKEVCRGWMFCK